MANGLLWPSSKSDSENCGLGGSASVTGVSSEGNALFVLKDIFHILDCFLEFHSSHSSSSFESVLVVNSHIIGSGLGSYGERLKSCDRTYILWALQVVLNT